MRVHTLAGESGPDASVRAWRFSAVGILVVHRKALRNLLSVEQLGAEKRSGWATIYRRDIRYKVAVPQKHLNGVVTRDVNL
jgi:hypothetical protein